MILNFKTFDPLHPPRATHHRVRAPPQVSHTRRRETRASAGTSRKRDRPPGRVAVASSHDLRVRRIGVTCWVARATAGGVGPGNGCYGDRCGGPRGEAVTGRLAGRAWAGAAGRGPRPALRRPGGRRRRTRPWARWLPGAARSRPRLPERHDQPIADRHQRADPRWTAREGARESPHALGRRRPVGRVEDPSTPEHVVHDQQAAGP